VSVSSERESFCALETWISVALHPEMSVLWVNETLSFSVEAEVMGCSDVG